MGSEVRKVKGNIAVLDIFACVFLHINAKVALSVCLLTFLG